MNNHKMVWGEIQKIVTRLASKALTGRFIDVKFQKPPVDGVRGLAFRGEDGWGVVYVDPDLHDDQKLKTILHEFAHIKKHYLILAGIGGVKRLAQYHVRDCENLMPDHKEQEARSIADDWYQIAVRLKPTGDYLQRLNALAGYVGEHWRDK